MSPAVGFYVTARTSFSGTFEHCLSFEADEEFQVLRWSKAGWWWASKSRDGQQGWIYSCQMKPKMCTSCHEKVQNLPPPQTEEDVDAVPTVEVEPWPPLPPTEEEAVVWPPLPPGSPPKGPKSEGREVSALDGDYAQTLSFRGDGKIVQQPQLSDHALRQCEYYFNYQQWIDGQNTAQNGKKRGKVTGDGGFKRKRA